MIDYSAVDRGKRDQFLADQIPLIVDPISLPLTAVLICPIYSITAAIRNARIALGNRTPSLEKGTEWRVGDGAIR